MSDALDLDETNPSETLAKRFGAYYEITVYTGSTFKKIGNVAYHYLTARMSGGEVQWYIDKTFFHEYLDNDLVVRRIEWGHEHGRLAPWQDCYLIGGMQSDRNANDVRRLIEETAPAPIVEVLCISDGMNKARVVRWRKHLVSFRSAGDGWFPSIDLQVAAEISREIDLML